MTHFVSETPKPVGVFSTDEISSIKVLKSLPYVTWVPIKDKKVVKSGVAKYDPNLSYEGINLYYTANKPGGCFFDMNGNVLHTFIDKTSDFFDEKTKKKAIWQIIEPYSSNYFVVLIRRKAIIMIDWASNIKWVVQGRIFHHDIAIADNGDIYALTLGEVTAPRFSSAEPIKNNWLIILTKDGKVKKEISFAEMVLRNKELFEIAMKREEKKIDPDEASWDIFHTNSIEIINRDIFSGDKKLFTKGNVLFCMRHQNLVGVVDIEAEKIIWSWGTCDLDYPHHPSLLENGNLLIFDNGYHRKYSRIIELNPVTKEVEWEYKGNPPESFFSQTRGSAQRLPNGNTLIAESDKGYVFEITDDGKIVWEFYNPEILNSEMKRAAIYRMVRIIDPEKYQGLERLNNNLNWHK